MPPRRGSKKNAASPPDPNPDRATRDNFPKEVAAACALDVAVVQKALEGLNIVVCRRMREKTYCRIPNMMLLRLKIIPARGACTRVAFGKEVQVKPREQMKKVRVSVLKPLKDAANG